MTRTSAATSSNRGFTLLEVLVAIAIVALVALVAIPTFNYVFRASADSFTQQTGTLLREARDRAILQRKVVRVRFDLGAQEFWAEEGPATLLLPPAVREATHSAREKESDEEKRKNQNDSFRLLKELTGKKRKLPGGVRVNQVINPRLKDPIFEGVADVYFFPNGSSEGVILVFEDSEKMNRSLLVHPITGTSRIRRGLLTKAEEFEP